MQSSSRIKPPVVDFGAAPVGYVAGFGRGATGFTTRSDVGSGSALTTSQLPAAVAGTGRGRNVSLLKGRSIAQNEAVQMQIRQVLNKGQDLYEGNYDAFAGYGGSLYDASVPYEADDVEADMVFEAIDKRMEERRKGRKEKRVAQEAEVFRRKNPKIEDQFADVKAQLVQVMEIDWMNIPEPVDYSRRNKRTNVREDLLTHVPDSIIHSAQRAMQVDTSVNPVGYATPAITDLTAVGRARDQLLGVRLDKMSDSVTGQTVVDPKGYLTDMNSLKISSDAEIGDLKKARLLLNSVITTNPKHAPGWIAAARLEETAGKMSEAKSIIMKGCEKCFDDEDIWIEAARLHDNLSAKAILAKANRYLPSSIAIWLKAVSLEDEADRKRAVLRRAIENVPNSVNLWKELIELEEPDDARILLRQAVKCVPQSAEMWLALARLESYDNARVALNSARKHIPNDISIWIAAAQLEESNNNLDMIPVIIQRAIKSLSSQKVVIDRNEWIKEAQKAEKRNCIWTCRAIVDATIRIGVEDQDRRLTWKNDANSFVSEGYRECAKAVYAHMLRVFTSKPELWFEAAQLERQLGSVESFDALLANAVKECPDAEALWLLGAKEKWTSGDTAGARAILEAAFAQNPDSEDIWLAAVKVEFESGEIEKARLLLERARTRANTARVWMRSAKFEREVGNVASELQLLNEAVELFPNFDKLWLMLGQFYSRENDYENASKAFTSGLAKCAKSAKLWICSANLEADLGSLPRARAILEKARFKLPQNELILLASVKVEAKSGDASATGKMLSKALQECPKSGLLWAYAIELEPRVKRRSKCYDAIQACGENPYACIAVGRVFWGERELEKAQNWFERAVAADPDVGDAWAYYFKFMEEFKPELLDAIVQKCIAASPSHGDMWCSVSKAIGNAKLKTEEILAETSKKAAFLL